MSLSLTNVAWIALALILIMSVVITVLTYFYVESVSKKYKKEAPKTIDPKKLIMAQEVQSDGVLAISSVMIGVISLEVFALGQKPEYIIGVNRGGWLLSTYLAHRLNIGRNNLLRFDAERNEIIDSDIDHDIMRNATILLVDDISRKGLSISRAIDYLKDKFPLSKLSVAVLVVCGRKVDEKITYNPYWTQYKDIQLPWSSDERKEEARTNISQHEKQEKVVRLGDENSLDKKVPVLRIADSDTKEGEGVDISNEDIELVKRFLAVS
jgi:hypoxanthine phosphoribosyltransferase